jgi:DNA-binding SARP family transcriptional activator
MRHQSVIESPGDLTPDEHQRLWVAEAARRYEQLKRGTARAILAEEVFARLDSRQRR